MEIVRLGELLVQAGLLSTEQVEQALRAQVMWGGRLGTNVVELHMLDLDELSKLIARQYGLPAAFAAHFESADIDLQMKLAPELAAQYACIPLRRVGPDRIAIASIAPLDGRARAIVADQLGISYKGLVPAIAPELRIHYHLERSYDIPRQSRFLRSRKRSKLPSFEIQLDGDDSGPIPAPPPPVEVDLPVPEAIPEELLPDFTPRTQVSEEDERERRRYLDTTTLGRIEIRRQPVEASTLRVPDSLDDATLAIRRSLDRNAIKQRVIETVAQFIPQSSAVLLVVRGDAATSVSGDIVVPLDAPNIVTDVLRDKTLVHAAPSDPVDKLLLQTLGVPDGELVIAPITIGTHVWSLLAIAVPEGAAIDCVEPITSAAAVAFMRLLRNANR